MNEAYEQEAARIGARSFTRTWRVKLAMLALFVAAVAVGCSLRHGRQTAIATTSPAMHHNNKPTIVAMSEPRTKLPSGIRRILNCDQSQDASVTGTVLTQPNVRTGSKR